MLQSMQRAPSVTTARHGGASHGIKQTLSVELSPGSTRQHDFQDMQERLRQKMIQPQRREVAPMQYGTGDSMRHAAGLSDEDDSIQPGQLQFPTRIGMDKHPLGMLRHADVRGDPFSRPPVEKQADSIDGEKVMQVAASSYFSAAVTMTGEVWTFGACFNGSLGGERDWSTSPQRVSGALADMLADNGGAVRIAAGGTFCAALTAFGRVVMWGKLPVPTSHVNPSAEPKRVHPNGAGAGTGTYYTVSRTTKAADNARSSAVLLEGLPAISHIAAGRQHVLLSDGRTVWGIGRWMDESGSEVGGAGYDSPAVLLKLQELGEEVAQLTCGPHSSGVVTTSGKLWMWGRLLDRSVNHPIDIDWEWSGFGAAEPTLVSGIHGVKCLALGGYHALAVVE